MSDKPLPTIDEIADEANLVAEYSGLSSAYTFDTEPGIPQEFCILKWRHGAVRARVHRRVIMLQFKGLPDKAKPEQLETAILNATKPFLGDPAIVQ